MPVIYTLKFDLAPDKTPSGRVASCKWYGETGPPFTNNTAANPLGTFGPSAPSNGSSLHVWTSYSADVSSFFSPTACHLFSEWDGTGGANTAHYRRIRVEGDDGSVYYGRWMADGPFYRVFDRDVAVSEQVAQDESADPPGPIQLVPRGGWSVGPLLLWCNDYQHNTDGFLHWYFT